MKKIACFLSVIAALFVLTGCVSVEVVKPDKLHDQALADSGKTIAHVNVQNWGLYFVNIPLFAGDPDSEGSIAVFKDTVKAKKITPVLVRKCQKLGGTQIRDAASQYSEFGFIFVINEINMSGNIVK